MLKEILTARTRSSDKALYNIWARKISGGWAETTITGSLPLTFQAKGGNLTDYIVHGTAEGAGVQTENLFDGVFPEYALNKTKYKQIAIPNGDYTLWTDAPKPNNLALFFLLSGYQTSGASTVNGGVWSGSPRTVNTLDGYITLAMHPYPNYDPRNYKITLIPGSTAPTSYIPYGYEIPLKVTSGQNTDTYPLYIGDTKLGTEEYVDYQEQKIYKDVSGTLTPTDPPLPFPAISTYQGENTLSSTETVGSVSLTGKIKEVTP